MVEERLLKGHPVGGDDFQLIEVMRNDLQGGSDAKIEAVLRIVRTHLGMDVGFVSEFLDGRRVFRHVDNGVETSPVAVGGSDALEESYCQRVIDGRLPQLILDACDNAEAL